MKNAYLIVTFIFITLACFAQDTIQTRKKSADTAVIEQIRVDTVVVEKLRVDTVYLQAKEQTPVQKNKQDPEETPQETKNKNDKVYYGAYASFSFGKYTIYGVEPMIAYKIFPRFSIGAKISYEYFKNKNYSPTREGSNYGVSVFSRFKILRKLYAHVEFAEMNYKLYNSSGETNREWIPYLYVGGGFSQPITKSISLNAEVLWDVLQNSNSPYKTVEPFFNVGLVAGF